MRWIKAAGVVLWCWWLLSGLAYADITSNLQGYWKFNESSGTTADASGNGNTGTLGGTAAYGAGKYGNGIVFTGSSTNAVSYGTGASLDITGTAITLAAWVAVSGLSSLSNYHAIFSRDSGAYAYRWFVTDNRDKMLFQAANGGISVETTSFTALTLGTFYHLAVVYNGTNVLFYVNASLVYTGNATASLTSQPTYAAQSGKTGASNYGMNGKLDSLHVYNRALSASDITELFNDTEVSTQVRRRPIIY